MSLGQLIAAGYLRVGQRLCAKDRRVEAIVKADAQLLWEDQAGSIHRIAAPAQGKAAFNGWEFWYCEGQDGSLISIDTLREQYRAEQL
jgi:hypothetical protein